MPNLPDIQDNLQDFITCMYRITSVQKGNFMHINEHSHMLFVICIYVPTLNKIYLLTYMYLQKSKDNSNLYIFHVLKLD